MPPASVVGSRTRSKSRASKNSSSVNKVNVTPQSDAAETRRYRKRRKRESSEVNAAGTVDYKDIINSKCFVELPETFTAKQTQRGSSKVNSTSTTINYKDIINSKCFVDLPIPCTATVISNENDELLKQSKDVEENNYNYLSNPIQQISAPGTCLEKNKETDSSEEVSLKKDHSKSKSRMKNFETDNYIKAPCHCSTKIQCFGPFSEGTYASKRIFGDGFEVRKLLKHEKSIMAGFMKIYSNSFISGKAATNTVYFVVEGKLKVTISGNVKTVKVNDCFMVIQDTEYEIKNTDDKHAHLSFVKTSGTL